MSNREQQALGERRGRFEITGDRVLRELGAEHVMSVQIAESCVTCGACLWECPLEAISPGEVRPVVDSNACTECYGFFGESQCMVVCPVGAIVVDRPEPLDTLVERYTRIHPEREPQDTWIWRRIVGAAAGSACTGA